MVKGFSIRQGTYYLKERHYVLFKYWKENVTFLFKIHIFQSYGRINVKYYVFNQWPCTVKDPYDSKLRFRLLVPYDHKSWFYDRN
jgi:hypothetical protein